MNNHKEKIKWIATIIIFILSIHYSPLFWGNMTAEKAFRESEEDLFYGPSEIIEEIDYGDTKIFFAKYKDWFSADDMVRHVILWYPDSVGANEIDVNEPISYTMGRTRNRRETKSIYRIYGHINNDQIVNLKLSASDNGQIKELVVPIYKDKMFIYHYDEIKTKIVLKVLYGYDENGKLIYTEDIPEF